MFNVCLSWSYCSCKSLAKLKCENDVYVYINEGLIIIIILMVLQLHLWLFYFPHHSLIVLGESRLTAILPFLRFPRKEESCSGEIIFLKVLYFLSSDKAFTTADMRFIEGEWKNTTVSDWGECTFAIPNIRQVNYSN